jgi:hypothetical protein
MKKLIFIFILSSIVCIKSYSQALNNKDSVIDEKITKNKFYPFAGFGMSTVEQKIIGPSTNLTSKLNVLNPSSVRTTQKIHLYHNFSFSINK